MILIFTMLHFFLKIKKNTCKYHYQNLNSSWDTEQNLLKLAILGQFLPFYTPKNLKNQSTVPEILSETDRIFCHFGPFFVLLLFAPLPHPQLNNHKNQNLEKKNEKMPGDIILLYIHVYHKWRSYDIWFLKYKVWQTEIFVILGYFLPSQPTDNLENQYFKIEKNTWRYYHFTHLHHK